MSSTVSTRYPHPVASPPSSHEAVPAPMAASAPTDVDAMDPAGACSSLPEWKPTRADEAQLAAATAAAQKLAASGAVPVTAYFTDAKADAKLGPNTPMYEALLAQMRTASKIRGAVYGVDKVPELIAELRAAVARGADVQIVVDVNADGSFTYGETAEFVAEFGPSVVRVENSQQSAIMHHKFWVFDDRYVWTGSANNNDTALGKGYNSEISILVDSPNLAKLFNAEHAQMWGGNFHNSKTDNTANKLPEGIEVYFSPTDDAMTDGIIPALEKAETSIHLTLFHFSDPSAAKALVDAHQRGVDVKLVIDATGAANKATQKNVELLRAAGIKVKVEMMGGKQHMKGGVIDGTVSIIGSMNWTKAGVQKNDENCLVFDARYAALGKQLEERFQKMYEGLPTISLYGYWKAEGLNSAGSLVDGSDNDYWQGPDPMLSWVIYKSALREIERAAWAMAQAENEAATLMAMAHAYKNVKCELERCGKRLVDKHGDEGRKVLAQLHRNIDGLIGSPCVPKAKPEPSKSFVKT